MRSLFQPIRTAVPGIHLCDHLPLIARHTDKMAIIRSMSHPSDAHEASVYHTLTGRQTPTLSARTISAGAPISPTSAR